MSKDLFQLMREQELQTENFLPTKKEVQTSSKAFAKKLIDSGDYNPIELFSQALRLKEALTVIESEIKNSLPDENFEAFGLKATYKQGGEMPQYKDDPIYEELYNKLKQRETLLKTVLKSDEAIYDSEGIEVPKVSVKHRKSSLTINY